MHTLHSVHCPFILIFSPLEYPMPIGLSVCHVYVTLLLLEYIIFIVLLLFNTTIPDPLGLSVCRLRGAHEGFVCTNTLCRQSLCAHKDLVQRSKIAWGGFKLCTQPLRNPLNLRTERFVGRAPRNLCALSLCAPPNLCTKSLCASRSLCGARGCSCRCKPHLHILLYYVNSAWGLRDASKEDHTLDLDDPAAVDGR